jgi:hypothetical protein
MGVRDWFIWLKGAMSGAVRGGDWTGFGTMSENEML